jgi:hypothetical protein
MCLDRSLCLSLSLFLDFSLTQTYTWSLIPLSYVLSFIIIIAFSIGVFVTLAIVHFCVVKFYEIGNQRRE